MVAGVLVSRLREVARRQRLQSALLIALWALAGIGLVSALALIAGPWAATLTAVVLFLAFLAWLARLGANGAPWSTHAAARKIDAALGRERQIASALEAHQAGQDTLLSRALIINAGNAAAGVEPRRLVPLFTSNTGLAALSIAAVLALPFIVPPLLPVAKPGVVESETEDTPRSVAGVTMEDLQAVARRVGIDSTIGDVDALMRAASGLEKLVRDAATGLSQEELETQLEALLETARMGYGDRQPGWMSTTDERSLAQRINTFETERQQQASAQPASSSPDSTETDSPDTDSGASTGNEGAAAPSPTLSGEGADDTMAEGATGEGEAGPRSAGSEAGPPGAGEPGGDDAFARQMGSSGGPVGAAEQSGEHGGNMAGQGTHALSETALVAAEKASKDMVISAAEENAGRRIRIDMDLPPGGAGSAAAASEDGSPSTPQGSTRDDITVLTREGVDAETRDVVSRYFMPEGAREDTGASTAP